MMDNKINIPIKIVGSSIFGRYPKISSEKTYNMIVSDDWLVPYSGYVKKINGIDKFPGSDSDTTIRAIYRSNRLKSLFVVVLNIIYKIDSNWVVTNIGNIDSSFGNVYVAESSIGTKIVFCDGITKKIWYYDYSESSPTIKFKNIDFIPAYISYQDGYFIAPEKNKPNWRLALYTDSDLENWPYVGSFQGTADIVKACIPLPGRGGQLFVVGESSIESWVNVGSSDFPYQKNTGYSLDYGCLSVDTIARSENIVAWLGGNKDSGSTIMYSLGGEAIQISTDGINYQLSKLKYPQDSIGFFFKEDGHLFYQLTFFNKEDNYTLTYDFTTQKFYNITDGYGDYHIAKNVALFNNEYCFISLNNPNIYSLGSKYTTYDGHQIPRCRITNNIRLDSSESFIINNITFPIEQGENKETARVDLSISLDSGVSYSNNLGMQLNNYGNRLNKMQIWNLGRANDFIARLQFWGNDRFVVSDGVVSIYK